MLSVGSAGSVLCGRKEAIRFARQLLCTGKKKYTALNGKGGLRISEVASSMDIRMGIYIAVALLLAFLMTYAATPVVRKFAIHVGAIDVPKDNRRMHSKPVPLMGGLAIFFSFTLGMMAFVPMDASSLGLLGGALIVTVMGVVDDVSPLRAGEKLLLEILAALIPVFCGAVIEKVAWFDTFIYFGDWSIPITVLWIVAITNTINLIDGLDGLACGISAISSLALLVVSVLSLHNQTIILVAAILAGACLGFLPYNRHPAQIFMGDAGALFLGYVLSVISIQGFFKVNAMIAFVAPFLVLGIPILDTLFAIVRRLLKGQHPFTSDRQHFHHKLIDMGLNQRQAVAVLYAVSALLGIAAILLAERNYAAGILVMVLSMVVGLLNLVMNRQDRQQNEASGEQEEMETCVETKNGPN